VRESKNGPFPFKKCVSGHHLAAGETRRNFSLNWMTAASVAKKSKLERRRSHFLDFLSYLSKLDIVMWINMNLGEARILSLLVYVSQAKLEGLSVETKSMLAGWISMVAILNFKQ